MVRLGFWQLDRLSQRRAFNSRVIEQVSRDPLVLDDPATVGDLAAMEYRQIVVSGEYDPSNEIALRNQVWRDRYGVHLVTPLKIQGTAVYILVDRGWIPGEDFEAGLTAGNWDQYSEPGLITIQGVIRRSQTKADFGRITDPEPNPGDQRILAWNWVNIEQIQKQTSYALLPVYIQQSPDAQWDSLPYRSEPDLELTEGSHLSYAIQWFAFAGLLFFGYPFYVQKEEKRLERKPIRTIQAQLHTTGESDAHA
jgi:surfeit locus 1 family protein